MACLAGAPPAAGADEVQVVSPRPDAVSLTIYRDLFALVTETRTVDLPAGPVTVVFDGVADTLIPQSAVLANAGRPIEASNFDYERLTPANLLRKSIGKTVTLTRINPGTGKVRQVAATLLAADVNGVVFRTLDGNEALRCSGLPERLTFDELPGDLKTKPTLSVRLAGGTAGKRQVSVSYIAQGFAWSSDYVARLNDAGNAMDITGWLTLRNLTNASFRDAQVQVIAGKLNLIDTAAGGSSTFGDTDNAHNEDQLDGMRSDRLEAMQEEFAAQDSAPYVNLLNRCYPLGTTSGLPEEHRFRAFRGSLAASKIVAEDIGDELQEIIVTGFRGSMALQEGLADYHMYRLPAHTDLAARQTKQVAFLDKSAVKIERFYGLRLAQDANLPDEIETDAVPAYVKIGWTNDARSGLGEPLPAGIVRFFEGREGGVFVGDSRLKDTSAGTPVELEIGSAIDVNVSMADTPEPDEKIGLMTLLTRRVYQPVVLRITNAKPQPVSVEIRQGKMFSEAWSVTGASVTPKRKSGDFVWRFTVPANGVQALEYKVSIPVEDY